MYHDEPGVFLSVYTWGWVKNYIYIHWFREKEKRTDREGHRAKTIKS